MNDLEACFQHFILSSLSMKRNCFTFFVEAYNYTNNYASPQQSLPLLLPCILCNQFVELTKVDAAVTFPKHHDGSEIALISYQQIRSIIIGSELIIPVPPTQMNSGYLLPKSIWTYVFIVPTFHELCFGWYLSFVAWSGMTLGMMGMMRMIKFGYQTLQEACLN